MLECTHLRYDFLIYGFVVVPNHVHLLISEPKQGTIATVIQSLKIATSRHEKTHIRQTKADMGQVARPLSISPISLDVGAPSMTTPPRVKSFLSALRRASFPSAISLYWKNPGVFCRETLLCRPRLVS